jgi:hypothetical protein
MEKSLEGVGAMMLSSDFPLRSVHMYSYRYVLEYLCLMSSTLS